MLPEVGMEAPSISGATVNWNSPWSSARAVLRFEKVGQPIRKRPHPAARHTDPRSPIEYSLLGSIYPQPADAVDSVLLAALDRRRRSRQIGLWSLQMAVCSLRMGACSLETGLCALETALHSQGMRSCSLGRAVSKLGIGSCSLQNGVFFARNRDF